MSALLKRSVKRSEASRIVSFASRKVDETLSLTSCKVELADWAAPEIEAEALLAALFKVFEPRLPPVTNTVKSLSVARGLTAKNSSRIGLSLGRVRKYAGAETARALLKGGQRGPTPVFEEERQRIPIVG